MTGHEAELFRILHLLNAGCPHAISADNFLRLVSIAFKGSPAVSAKAKHLLRERFGTQVQPVRSI